ncbi:MAG: SBBP repeat-containing protein [Candidatus Zixiibacteriota bacterium]
MLGSRATASAFATTLTALIFLFSFGHNEAAFAKSATAPMSFTENAGQWEDNILFRASAGAATMWFGRDGAYYQFSRELTDRESPLRRDRQGPSPTEVMLVKAAFVGARGNPEVVGQGKLDYRSNYFLGNDPSRWRTNVANFESIVYRGLYPGIDLRYFGNGEYLEYDFIVSAGADPSVIEVRYEGADGIYVNGSGELVVETGWGTVTERCPYVYQETSTGRVEVVGSYRQISPMSFGFSLDGGYDRSLPLIIDPVLTHSTYIGGWASEYGWGVQIDDEGFVYTVGVTNSADYPVVNALQNTLAGDWDITVSKINFETGQYVYSTYLGSIAREENPRMDIDEDGCAYIVARTFGSDFPLVNAYDNTLGGTSDALLTKISAAGDQLVYSTFLGGSDDDFGTGIFVDKNFNAYVTTTTYSSDFPLLNPYQASPGQGSKDLTVTKFTSAGNQLLYSTYLGGTQDEEGRGLHVDSVGRVYLTGYTYSKDFPVVNAYDAILDGATDGFIARLGSSGNVLDFSTYFGGTSSELCTALDLDRSGNIYVAGGTASTDLPIVGGFQPVHSGGGYLGYDIFLSKFSPTAGSLLYSTFMGGTDDDFGEGMCVGRYNDVYLTGYTYSFDFPLVDPLFAAMVGTPDAFVARVGADGSELKFSTYLGGSAADVARTVVISDLRSVYVTGYTTSTNFPIVDPVQPYRLGTRDGFVSMIDFGCCEGIVGNVDYDPGDYVDAMDVLYFVSWLYKQGPAPGCLMEADANGDGQLDPQDLVYLIAFIWQGGPAPSGCY